MNNSDFPQMGDFPDFGEEQAKPMQKKSEMSGSYASMAKDNSAPEKGSGISFSKGGPPVFTSKKKKTADPTELAAAAQGNQNYDFSKMNLATASKKFVEGEGGEGQTETTTMEDGTKVIQKKVRHVAQRQDNGFDSDDGFQKATDTRKRAPREARQQEDDDGLPETEAGWGRN